MNEREERLALLSRLRAIAQELEAIRKYRQAGDNQKRQPLPIDLRSELRLPISITEYCETKNNVGKSRWPQIKAGLEIMGFATAAAIACFTFLTFKQIKRQTEAAMVTSQTTHEELVRARRPWLIAYGIDAQPPLFDSNSVHVTARAMLKNVGNTPAFREWDDIRLIISPIQALYGTPNMIDCEFGKTEALSRLVGGKVIVPEAEPYTVAQELIKPNPFINIPVIPVLAVCIAYRDEFDKFHACDMEWQFVMPLGEGKSQILFRRSDGQLSGSWQPFGIHPRCD